MSDGEVMGWIALGALALFVLSILIRSVRVVPQAEAWIVERLGRYARTLDAGLHLLLPFVDRVRAKRDLREQVISFPPQSVITSDNLVVEIDTVIYFQVTDARAAVYEIANFLTGVEQLTVTTLRNVVGTMDLEQTLTSRDQINGQLRGVLDEATDKWGIRVARVELKTIEPPMSIKDSMEKQMRAERDRRAAILTAEGDKQSAILKAEGKAQATILEAEGQARAILQVFGAIHEGDPDSKLLAYQYLQMLPEIAKSESSKVWFVPTEFTGALKAISAGFGAPDEPKPLKASPNRKATQLTSALGDSAKALAEAKAELKHATDSANTSGTRSGRPFDPEVEKGQ
jgi:regulator of protease activity HflC (stomatin/prohibitin superfamily)